MMMQELQEGHRYGWPMELTNESSRFPDSLAWKTHFDCRLIKFSRLSTFANDIRRFGALHAPRDKLSFAFGFLRVYSQRRVIQSADEVVFFIASCSDFTDDPFDWTISGAVLRDHMRIRVRLGHRGRGPSFLA